MTETPVPNKPCFICQSTKHLGEQCPIVPTMREMLVEQANVVGQFKPQLMHHMGLCKHGFIKICTLLVYTIDTVPLGYRSVYYNSTFVRLFLVYQFILNSNSNS